MPHKHLKCISIRYWKHRVHWVINENPRLEFRTNKQKQGIFHFVKGEWKQLCDGSIFTLSGTTATDYQRISRFFKIKEFKQCKPKIKKRSQPHASLNL